MGNENIFDRALQTLETKGWIQGRAKSPKGCCLVTAINCSGTLSETIKAFEQLRTIVNIPLWSRMHEWNDVPERTKDEVLNLLKQASKEYNERIR